MRFLRYLTPLFLCQLTLASAITVPAVKISVTAESAAAAREQALTKAYELAYVKLIQENYPEEPSTLPPQETLMNMVTTFSIDREKTTSNSYAALITFQFDESKIQEWRAQSSSSPLHTLPPHRGENIPIKVTATYANQQEWQTIRKALEGEAHKLDIITFSLHKADLELTREGDMLQLQERLQHKGLDMTPQDQEWIVSIRPFYGEEGSSTIPKELNGPGFAIEGESKEPIQPPKERDLRDNRLGA